MKLIKITDDHYVVVDETIQPVNGYYYDDFIKEIRDTSGAEYGEASHCWQITHSTRAMYKDEYISLQEVKELIGEVDVEKKAFEYTSASQAHRRGFIDGYNQALKDNKEKKYTEAQLIWAIQEAYGHGQDDEFDGVYKVEESIEAITKYLQPKTQWEYIGECKGNNGNGCFMDSPGHDCGCYKRVPKTSWEVEIVDGKLKLK